MSYTITVKQGNLLDEADAIFIVNASNTQLVLGSGVSMAFKRHCGNTLQTEMTQCLNVIRRALKKGEIVATSSADATNFHYALHAAIMDYSQGVKQNEKYPTLETISVTLDNIDPYLEWYAKEKHPSVKLVLPLMGCGVGGLDKVEVLQRYKEHFEKEISFECEVVIYGYTDEDYEMIRKMFDRF